MATCVSCDRWYEHPKRGGQKYCSSICHFRYLAQIDDGCWSWGGNHNHAGYGFFVTGGRGMRVLAHRFSYEAYKEPIPEGLCVLHHCDNPGCIKPSHLFAGTRLDNMQDCVKKGRNSPPPRPPYHFEDTNNWKHGDSHYCAKVDEEAVRFIRSSCEKGTVLARRFGVAKSAISAIRKRKTWKHVP